MRLPRRETLGWTISPKMNVSDLWELMWAVTGAPSPARGTPQQCWCFVTCDGFTGSCTCLGRGGDKGGLFPGAGEEKRAATFTFLSFTCVSLRFVFTLLLGLWSLELQEPPGEGSSLQGESTAWPLPCRGARTSAEARRSPRW